MDVKWIPAENPKVDQWRLLSQYSYPSNISRYLVDNGHTDFDDHLLDFIAGCVQQSKAYFDAAENAPLDISPLLLYYGATNLLTGVGAMLAGTQLTIHEHGMKLGKLTTPIADVEMTPINPTAGALQQFSNVFSDGCVLTNGATWNLGEILGSIPDLKVEFDLQYPDRRPYAIPVEVVHTRQGDLERIVPRDIEKYHDHPQLFDSIPGFHQSYLRPQTSHQGTYVILRYKMQANKIGTYSLTGQKYLQIAHRKNRQFVSPHQLLLMIMGLFSLGYLSRYHPQIWHPFVRRDDTGERLVVEKFLSVVLRYLPNLVLDAIYGYRIQFINEAQGTTDLTASITDDDIHNIVKDMQRRGDLL